MQDREHQIPAELNNIKQKVDTTITMEIQNWAQQTISTI